MPARRIVPSVWIVVFLIGPVAGGAATDPALRLEGVPQQLIFPLPEGINRTLTAVITGGDATAVWLADDKAARLRVQLRKVGDGQYQISLADPDLEAWVEAKRLVDRFYVFARLQDGRVLTSIPVHFGRRGMWLEEPSEPPDELGFRGTLATVEVHQRRRRPVPGSHDYLWIELGDITGGQALLTLRTRDGEELIHQASVRQGDCLPFQYNERSYTLHIRKLVNLLLGDDWALIDVSRVTAPELKLIERLLQHIEQSPVTFIRNEREYTGRESAQHLRQKLAVAGPRVQTAEQFIEQIASRSSVSGKPYRIRLQDGKTIEARVWLSRVLRERSEGGTAVEGEGQARRKGQKEKGGEGEGEGGGEGE